MKTHLKIIFTSFIAVILGSCSLELQEYFEFEPEVFTQGAPFKNLTAWEFIQTKITERNENNEFLLKSNTSILNQSGDNLDFFLLAIKAIGYEEFYNQTSTSNRTYFLLNNNAFTGNSLRDIVRMIRRSQLPDGSSAGRLVNPDMVFENWTEVQLNQLKALLRYCLVSKCLDQNTIPTSFVHLIKNTLLPKVNLDANGVAVSLSNETAEIGFFKNGDSRQQLRLNEPGVPLLVSAS